ncbi:hypothetical protein HanIR_Chr11g0510551 [Helianthus annuus]|nr:hypothetical protein HanIR_Chr11g0510551 [Helianthus annuus]
MFFSDYMLKFGASLLNFGNFDVNLLNFGFAEVKKQIVIFLQTVEVWSTSSGSDVCRCSPQTADILPLKKQTAPNYTFLNMYIFYSDEIYKNVNLF